MTERKKKSPTIVPIPKDKTVCPLLLKGRKSSSAVYATGL